MKEKVLGKKYELSISFIGAQKMRKINREFRQKDYATDILSFSLTKNSGELLIHLPKVRKNAPLFERNFEQHLRALVIHGMLHLKGMAHGSRMESMEEKFSKIFRF